MSDDGLTKDDLNQMYNWFQENKDKELEPEIEIDENQITDALDSSGVNPAEQGRQAAAEFLDHLANGHEECDGGVCDDLRGDFGIPLVDDGDGEGADGGGESEGEDGSSNEGSDGEGSSDGDEGGSDNFAAFPGEITDD